MPKFKLKNYMRGECCVCGTMEMYKGELQTCKIKGVTVDVCSSSEMGYERSCGEKMEEHLKNIGVI